MKAPKPKRLTKREEKEAKLTLIKQIIESYSKGFKDAYSKQEFKPVAQDIKEYHNSIKYLSLVELRSIKDMKYYNLKLDKMDRLKSLNKKKYAVVTVFNDNNTSDTGVAHINARSFSRDKMRYLIMDSRGIMDPEFSMMHFYYFTNRPFPLIIKKGDPIEDQPDGKLLDDTIEFEILTALANINISKLINLILVVSVLTFLLVVITAFITAKTGGLIG